MKPTRIPGASWPEATRRRLAGPLTAFAVVAVSSALLLASATSARAAITSGNLTLTGVALAPVDTDRSGLWDTLVVNVSVDVTTPGPFELMVTLFVPANPGFLGGVANGTDAQLPIGPHTFSVPLSTEVVTAVGLDGPYRVDVQISTLSAAGYQTNLVTNQTTTPAWSPSQFDGPPVRIAGPLTDEGLDVHGDGHFDELVVHVPLQVLRRTQLTVYGVLQKLPLLDFAGSPWKLRTFDPGTTVADVVFHGLTIFKSGVDGPYNVTVNVSGWQLVVNGSRYTTAAYSHMDFARPTADFEGPPTLSLAGLNTGGRANALRVHVPLRVRVPGNFTVSVDLFNVSYPLPSWSHPDRFVHLEAGDGSVDVDLSGTVLHRLPAGPLDLRVDVGNMDGALSDWNVTFVRDAGFDPAAFEGRTPADLYVNLVGSVSGSCAFVAAMDPVSHVVIRSDTNPPAATSHFAVYDGVFDVLVAGCGRPASALVTRVTVSGSGTMVNMSLPPGQAVGINYSLKLSAWDAGTMDTELMFASSAAQLRWWADAYGNMDGTADAAELSILPEIYAEYQSYDSYFGPVPFSGWVTVDGRYLVSAWSEALLPHGAGDLTSTAPLVLTYRDHLQSIGPVAASANHTLTVDEPFSTPFTVRSLQVNLPPGASGNLTATNHIDGFYDGFDYPGNETVTRLGPGSWKVTLPLAPGDMPALTLARASVAATQGPVPDVGVLLAVTVIGLPLGFVAVTALLWWARRGKSRPPEVPPSS